MSKCYKSINTSVKEPIIGQKYIEQILFISKLLYPKYPSYFFPIFLYIEFVKKLKFENMIPDKNQLALKAIPNKLYDVLISDEVIKSEHIAFVSKSIYENYVDDQFNYLYLKLHNVSSVDKKLDQQLIKLQCWENIDPNTIFIKENFYENFKDLNNLKTDIVYGSLRQMPTSSSFPKIATKASISIIKLSYELSNEYLDHVISKYFESPRLLYRNYIYEINLDEQILGTYHFSKNHQISTQLNRIHFKVATLTTKDCDLEYAAVVAKNFTNLQSSETFLSPIPKQRFDNFCFVTKIPYGLEKYYYDLKSCLTPFIHAKQHNSSRMKEFATKNIYPIFMVQGDKGTGKFTMVDAVANSLGFHVYYTDCTEIMSPIPSQTVAKLKTIFGKANLCQPLILCFENFEVSSNIY